MEHSRSSPRTGADSTSPGVLEVMLKLWRKWESEDASTKKDEEPSAALTDAKAGRRF